ncbi:MAG: hypothetical protein PHC52_11265 [Syntrophales bacterium]|nr:hypothetical protein [Syntrophales bacterium]
MLIQVREQDGFALVAAMIASLVLLAFGIMAVLISTRDIRVSSRLVFEKKAFSAAETGIHAMIGGFNPDNPAASAASDVQADPADASVRYTVGTPTRPTTGPDIVPMAGYAIGGGQQWGQSRYVAEVAGTHTDTNSRVDLRIGIGYGPIEISTMSR